jgi:hypothetical protein
LKETATLENKSLTPYVLLTQGIGLVFFVVFVAAYFGGLPSSGNLIGNPTVQTILSLFGGIFLILMVGVLLAAALAKRAHHK